MSILIKEMDMPKGVKDVMITFYDEDGMDIYCEDIYNLERVVEIPTPHGRLIDADDLETDTEWSEYLDGFMSYSWMEIQEAPTILEAEG